MKYEGLLQRFIREIWPLSKGQLNCLPHARALLDFFEAQGTVAYPLVVRCVVFGRLPRGGIELPMEEFAEKAIASASPDGQLLFESSKGSPEEHLLAVKYRTLGFSHGAVEPGSYSADGSWTGHLVVVAENTLIDPTLGQLNHPKYDINLNPPYLAFDVDDEFLNGRETTVGSIGENCIYYKAFPDEQTYEKSRSWSDPKFRAELKQVGVTVANSFAGKSESVLHAPPKIDRNAPCPCGSKKKYKKCHGA